VSSYLKDLWHTISFLYDIFRPHIGPVKIIVVVLIAAIIAIANYLGWPISNRLVYYAAGILIFLAIIYVLVKRIRQYEIPKTKVCTYRPTLAFFPS
jgi:hypothetical protein